MYLFEDVLILANSVDPDEMSPWAFHLGLHCLQKYLFTDDSKIDENCYTQKL